MESATDPGLPNCDMGEILQRPWTERMRLLVRSWADLAMYWLKYVLAEEGPAAREDLDASNDLLAAGETEMSPIRAIQPWPTREFAEAIERGRQPAPSR